MGCAVSGGKLIIAGGKTPHGVSLKNTEVIDLHSKSINYGGNMVEARDSFSIVTLHTGRTFAIGGSHQSGMAKIINIRNLAQVNFSRTEPRMCSKILHFCEAPNLSNLNFKSLFKKS